jgi:hypothetical protein
MTMMKTNCLSCWLAAVLALTAGCATDPTRVSVPAVGPMTGTPPGHLGSGNGTLRVFTQAAPYNDGQAPPVIHALCSIYTQAGKLVERFPNAALNLDAPPFEFSLPAGHYLVSVPTPGYGQVTVPVVIVAGALTPLYLDHSGMANKDNLPESELSRLPNTVIVGRRAYPPPPPPAKTAPAEKKP